MNEIALRLASRIFDKPLITNLYRSAFIEAMIEPHLTPRGWRYVGDNWDGWDFQRGDDRLEVKQSAAHQTWSEPRKLKTRGAFDIAPRTGYFDEDASKFTPMAAPGRCAQTYLFAWNPVYGLPEVDHRNPNQWEFYVVPAAQLPQGQRTIRLSKIKAITKPVKLEELSAVIERACASLPI